MDPVAGWNANAYVYPGDPVNGSDVSGDIAYGLMDVGGGGTDYKVANAVCGGWQMILCALDAGELKGLIAGETVIKGSLRVSTAIKFSAKHGDDTPNWAARLPHYHVTTAPSKAARTSSKWHRPWQTVFSKWFK